MSDMITVEMSKKYFKELIKDNIDLIDKVTYLMDSYSKILKVIVKDRD